jgi:hypothetical protein
MICKNCKTRDINNMWENNINYEKELFIYCSSCRTKLIPYHIPDDQYVKYWIEFSRKNKYE